MAEKHNYLKTVPTCAMLFLLVAGTSAGAVETPVTADSKVREVVNNETVMRTQMLQDIDKQRKDIEAKFARKEFVKASDDCFTLVNTLSNIPGEAAKALLAKVRKLHIDVFKAWMNDVMSQANALLQEKKFEKAIEKCALADDLIENLNNDVSTAAVRKYVAEYLQPCYEDYQRKTIAPFVEKCHTEIKGRDYNKAIDVNTFDPQRATDTADIDRLMREAATYYKNNKYQEVISTLEKVYLIDPFNVQATTLLDKTYGKIFRKASARHGVTTQQMLSMIEWDWVMPLKVNRPKRTETVTRSPEIKVAKNAVEEKMSKIIFSKFDSPGMDIKKILNFLDSKSKAYDPDGVGVTIIPQLSATEMRLPKFQKIYMRFNNIPLSDILRYLCMNLGIRYKISDHGDVIVGMNIDDMVSTPYYLSVPDQLIADIINGPTAAAAAAPAEEAVADAGAEVTPDGDAIAPVAAAPATSDAEAKMKAYFSARGVPFPAGSSIVYNRRLNRLEVINSHENLIRLEELVRQISAIEIPMVMTEVKFIEVTETDFNQLGFDWNFSLSDSGRKNGLWNFTVGTNFVSQEEANDKPTAFIQNLNLLPNFDDDWGGLKPSLNVTVHALSQNDNVEILTTPRLISKNGMAASIRMVTETRYPESWEAPEIETESDNVTTISFTVPDLGEPTTTGIELTVTPTVNYDNTITLDLHPEIITFLGSENSGYPVSVQQGIVNRQTGSMVPTMINRNYNIWMPELGRRRIDAKVKVEDGETIVLGGIINSTVERTEERMPLLGSIPLFGRLFQNRSEESSKTNLLIFVTARLINSDGHPVKSVENNGTPHFNF